MILKEFADSLELSLSTEVTLVDGIEYFPSHLTILHTSCFYHIVIPNGIQACGPLFFNNDGSRFLGLLVTKLEGKTQ